MLNVTYFIITKYNIVIPVWRSFFAKRGCLSNVKNLYLDQIQPLLSKNILSL